MLHCPYCHGYEVRGQKTGILADGNTAFELSSLVYNWTQDLTIYTNGKSALSESQRLILGKCGITTEQKEIAEIVHEQGNVHCIRFKDAGEVSIEVLYSRVPFVQSSDIPRSLGCELTADGYILTDAAQRTSVSGIYACGDNTSKIRTVANAVSSGTTTGLMLNRDYMDSFFRK